MTDGIRFATHRHCSRKSPVRATFSLADKSLRENGARGKSGRAPNHASRFKRACGRCGYITVINPALINGAGRDKGAAAKTDGENDRSTLRPSTRIWGAILHAVTPAPAKSRFEITGFTYCESPTDAIARRSVASGTSQIFVPHDMNIILATILLGVTELRWNKLRRSITRWTPQMHFLATWHLHNFAKWDLRS